MMTWVELEWNHETIRVPAQRLNGKLWFHLDGEVRAVELSSGRSKGSSASEKGDGILKAPMPGKILKVFVSDGEKVEIGKAILAMEAMKMEYTLEADKAGVVKGLTYKVGDQVTLGTVLARIEDTP